MSTYYTYYLGYEKPDGKIYPLGPYDDRHKLHNICYWTQSFASSIYKDFSLVSEEKISDELRTEFEYEDWNGKKRCDVYWAYAEDIPCGTGEVHGYFPIDDVQNYIDDNEYFSAEELKYSMLTAEEFAINAAYELKHGEPRSITYDDGIVEQVGSCKDYILYSFVDQEGEEYQGGRLHAALDSFEFSESIKDGVAKPVFLLTIE